MFFLLFFLLGDSDFFFLLFLVSFSLDLKDFLADLSFFGLKGELVSDLSRSDALNGEPVSGLSRSDALNGDELLAEDLKTDPSLALNGDFSRLPLNGESAAFALNGDVSVLAANGDASFLLFDLNGESLVLDLNGESWTACLDLNGELSLWFLLDLKGDFSTLSDALKGDFVSSLG